MGRKPMPEALRNIQRHTPVLRTLGDVEYFAQEMYRKGARDAAEKAVNTRLLMVLWVLHDKFGFGNKRLMRLMDEMNALADAMNVKLLGEKGIIKALKGECDLEITM
ncbi:hypothetical protein [Selenomonas bovis]|uniref:hypothetical protein n=1 Tax=Selenomonas bovis TaxID=416586 RepID=UPI000373700E|nr:hypothetical protein [Selenomonas bovis]